MKSASISEIIQDEPADFVRQAEAWLAAAKARLEGIQARLNGAVASGRADGGGRLDRVRQQAECHLAIARHQLRLLKEPGEDSWQNVKQRFVDANDDFARSIKSIVGRLS